MHRLTLVTIALFTVASSSFATAPVSAETLWELLPGTAGTGFTGKSGKATLQVKGGMSISCTASEVKEKEGELLNSTTALAIIRFSSCTTGGLGINSLGDPGNVILAHVEISTCLIKTGDSGLYLKLLPLHLEVPSIKLLLTVQGGLLALVSPTKESTKTFALTIEQKGGVQTIEKCEGGSARTLETSTDGGAFVQSGEEVKEGTIIFAAAQEAMSGGGEGGAEPTTLSTRLSGESKESEELTVLEGAKVKDKATLAGKNASKATGKVTYKVYSDKECKTLVTAAGEATVTGESVPASSEEELEGGKTYYWQAHYGGDAKNAESTSPCTEILNVKAKTSLSTKLSGESKESEELTVLEGAKVKDKATLSGTNSSTAGGKVLYKVFSDKECKTAVTEAGEVTVSSGSVPVSSEEELEGGKTYYWQAIYKGDSVHQESKSTCGGEVLKVKAKTTLTTELSGEGLEGEELTIQEGAAGEDKATVSGTNSSTAEGKVLYKVYSDSKCEHEVEAAGEEVVTSGSAAASNEMVLEADRTYYWQATYKGDDLHQESTSTCGTEVLNMSNPWLCYRTQQNGHGNRTTNNCGGMEAPGNFIWASQSLFRQISRHVFCSRVAVPGTGDFVTDACSTGGGIKAWIEVRGSLLAANGFTPPFVTNNKGAETFGLDSGSVKCATVKGSGTGASTIITEAQTFSGCEAFGNSVTISETEYEFQMEGGLGIVGKNLVITDSADSCSVTIFAGGSNGSLEEVVYADGEPGTVRAEIGVEGVQYEASGGVCGAAEHLYTDGTISGTAELGASEGSLMLLVEPTE
jgi:hypothetical protein